MSELKDAVKLANRILDRLSGDPDDDLAVLGRQLLRQIERGDKLQAFKDWVHGYLDGKGVPHHPPGTHGAEGCRIGDRMDWLVALIGGSPADYVCERCEGDGWAHGADRPFEWSGPGTYPGPCPACNGTGHKATGTDR
jgi:hypothetical protein